MWVWTQKFVVRMKVNIFVDVAVLLVPETSKNINDDDDDFSKFIFCSIILQDKFSYKSGNVSIM